MIRSGQLTSATSSDEVKLVERVAQIKSAANGLSKKTPLHKIKDLCEELDRLEESKKTAAYEFEVRAREAQDAAKKVEWIRSTIEDAKFVLAAKMQTTYEFCRRVANQCCADLEIRNAVFTRDNFACVICHQDENLSIDHIMPVRCGGTNDLENLQTLCLPCNLKKGWKFDGRKMRQKNADRIALEHSGILSDLAITAAAGRRF